MNVVEQYYEEITSGRIVVSAKVRKVYDHVIYNMHHPGKYHFDEKKAKHAIDFVQCYCRQTKGRDGGKLLSLLLWQQSLTAIIFGFVDDDGLRQYQEVFLLIARKNGKTTWAAAIALYALMCDGEAGPEVYTVATQQKQARICWDEAWRMVRKDPSLRKRTKTLHNDIKCLYNDGVCSPLTRDSGKMDGANPSCVIMDEIHAWTDNNLYDVLQNGMLMRQQPLIVITTTAGFVRENVYDKKYEKCVEIIDSYENSDAYTNERMLPMMYELDDKAEIDDESVWVKANPSLGGIFTIDDLRKQWQDATTEEDKRNVLTKHFNVPQTSKLSYFSFEDIFNPEKFELTGLPISYGIGGLDLSDTIDLTCASMIFKIPNDDRLYVHQHYWIPESLFERHIKSDKVPYSKWVDDGWISLCPGNHIDYHMISQWFLDLQENNQLYLYACGYDKWQARYLTTEMEQYFGASIMKPVIQGKKTLSVPMQNLKALIQEKKVIYNDNPVLRWCMANVVADVDINGNVQPCKDKAEQRIDGFASLLDAYVVYENDMENYNAMI